MNNDILVTKIDSLVRWIAENIPNDRTLFVPVSGGSDSALCIWLCEQASPGRVIGLYHGTEPLRSAQWFESFSRVQTDETAVQGFKDAEVFRWARFLETSLQNNGVLVGSRTKTEHHLGTFSLASRVATTYPLFGLWKSEVMELAKYIKMPREIIESSLRADPECGRPQELAEITYDEVDTFLQQKLAGTNGELAIGADQLNYLEGLYKKNSFKSLLPFTSSQIAL